MGRVPEKTQLLPGNVQPPASHTRLAWGDYLGRSQTAAYGIPYSSDWRHQDLGDDYFDRQKPTRTTRKLLNRLEKRG
jgi:hypothetical protein